MVYSLSFMEGSDEIMGTATSKLFTLEARLVPTSPVPRSSIHGQGTPCPYITQSTTHDPRSPEPRSSTHDPRPTILDPRSPDKARLVPT